MPRFPSLSHEFILGATVKSSSTLAEHLVSLGESGSTGPEIEAAEAAWLKKHELMTFDEGELLTLRLVSGHIS